MSNQLKFTLLCLLCLLLAMADLAFGSISVSLLDLKSWLLGQPMDNITHAILSNIRLPKMITAILAGAGLSVAGLLMQTLFQNPLAGPYILGVSSGATLGVAITLLTGALTGAVVSSQWVCIGAAIVGALLVLLLVLGVSFRVRSSVSLLIVGLMVGNIAGALVNVMQNYSNPDSLKLFIVWTFGSLSSVSWTQMQALAPICLLGLLLACTIIKPLNGLLLGENYARGLGINIMHTRLIIIVATGLLAGGITAFTGPIAFIGVAIPHIARGLFGTSNHRISLPASALCGSALLLVCDLISQMATHTLPISTVSALFGAPIIIWIILRKKK